MATGFTVMTVIGCGGSRWWSDDDDAMGHGRDGIATHIMTDPDHSGDGDDHGGWVRVHSDGGWLRGLRW